MRLSATFRHDSTFKQKAGWARERAVVRFFSQKAQFRLLMLCDSEFFWRIHPIWQCMSVTDKKLNWNSHSVIVCSHTVCKAFVLDINSLTHTVETHEKYKKRLLVWYCFCCVFDLNYLDVLYKLILAKLISDSSPWVLRFSRKQRHLLAVLFKIGSPFVACHEPKSKKEIVWRQLSSILVICSSSSCAEADNDPLVWIGCAGAGKHPKHAGQGFPGANYWIQYFAFFCLFFIEWNCLNVSQSVSVMV